VLRAFSFVCMLPPLPRRSDWFPSAQSPSRVSLPRSEFRVGLRIVLFEACSAFTHVAACTLALSPYIVTSISRRLQPFRYLHSCSGSFRLEHLPGGTCTHWKTPPFHGAPLKRTFGTDILKLQLATFQYSSNIARCDARKYHHRDVRAETFATRHKGCADAAHFSSCA
jgi:hypothetical protein